MVLSLSFFLKNKLFLYLYTKTTSPLFELYEMHSTATLY